MSTQAQVTQAELALQRAIREEENALIATNEASRALYQAQETGSIADRQQALNRLEQSTAQLAQANRDVAAAQQNYNTVSNQPDTDAAQDPQVNNNPQTQVQTFAVSPQPVLEARPLGAGAPDTSLLGRTPPPVVQPFGAGPPDTSLLITPLPPPPPLVTAPPAVNDPPDPAAAGPERQEIGLANVDTNRFIFGPDGELLPADSPYAISIAREQEELGRVNLPQNVTPQPVGGDYVASYNPETGKWDVVDLATGATIKSGLTEQAATLDAQNLSVGDPGYGGLAARNFGVAYDEDGNLLPGYTLDEDNNPVYVGGDFVEPATAASAEASRAQALLDQARQQASVSALRKASGKAVGDGDWRVRLRLAPSATYLYKTPGIGSAGILEPLRDTDGVVFPYTPRIDMAYTADYNAYDLTHSNYRGYFYKGSNPGEVVMNADFTAQDSNEADYLLATIHFLRSCTKMFYGQDKQRGTPPPLVFLSGLGDFQFNEHPCVIKQFNYNLPSDVDYIRARGRQSTSSGVTQGGNGLMFRRTLSSTTTASYSLSSIWSRLTGANLPQGGMNIPPAPPNLGLNSPTYVPTKITISITLLPMPTRSQVSQQFSLEKYANGNLLRGGFW